MAEKRNPDDAPPPYDGPPAQSQTSQYQASQPLDRINAPAVASSSSSRPQPIPRQFPPAFNIYVQAFSRTVMLAEHQEQPFYAAKFHSGWSGNAAIVLHSGPTETFSTLAEVDFKPFSTTMTVTLPAPLRMRGGPPVDEEVHLASMFHRQYTFSIEVGVDESRRELFEWRYSSGDAIAQLDGSMRGWKLVRMAEGPPPGLQGGSFVPGGYTTSDGREVVAAYTDAVMSMTKAAKFAFLGTGTSGLLGERWAIMAVMSALGIYEISRRAKRRSH